MQSWIKVAIFAGTSLFVVLILLNLFLVVTGVPGNGKIKPMDDLTYTNELKSQEINKLKLNCQALCDGVNDVNSAIEFCANYQSLYTDQNKNMNPSTILVPMEETNPFLRFLMKIGLIRQRYRTEMGPPGRPYTVFGKYSFCREKVPCFLIINNCQNGLYTAQSCKQLLLRDPTTQPFYEKIVKNINSEESTFDDGCGLPIDERDSIARSNWKLQHGYTSLPTALASTT